MNEENVSVWNKNTNDLTVGDVVKVNVMIMAVAAAIPLTMAAGATVAEKVRIRRAQKALEAEPNVIDV